jgi:antitoxin (DNA-binding transcriptional repressor) of toxin-antitoxin stability system
MITNMQVALSDLKTNVVKFVDLAETEDVIIIKYGKPAAKIVRFDSDISALSRTEEQAADVRPPFQFGCLKGVLDIDDDFSDVLADFEEY